MVRDGATLERAFELHPEYLKEHSGDQRGRELRRSRAAADAGEPGDQGLARARDVRRRGVPRGDRSRAGPRRRRPAPDRGRRPARARQPGVAGHPDVPSPGRAGRDRPRRPTVGTRRSSPRSRRPATSLLTSTLIGGRYAIRLCVLNHTVGPDDVAYALDRSRALEPAASAGRRAGARRSGQRSRPASSAPIRPPADLSVDELAGDRAVRERHRRPGRAVPRDGPARSATRSASRSPNAGRWLGRSTSCATAVSSCGSAIARSTPSDPATTSARSRRSTGAATSATAGRRRWSRRSRRELLAFPAAALRELMTDIPAIDRAIRRVAQARIATR